MKHLKSYKLFESVSNFPEELDIRDIFLELLDNGVIENVKDWESGWIYFCTEKLGVGSSIRNEIYPAMIDFPDVLDFGACPVKFNSEKPVIIRNLG